MDLMVTIQADSEQPVADAAVAALADTLASRGAAVGVSGRHVELTLTGVGATTAHAIADAVAAFGNASVLLELPLTVAQVTGEQYEAGELTRSA